MTKVDARQAASLGFRHADEMTNDETPMGAAWRASTFVIRI
jgi:hypothetical protein